MYRPQSAGDGDGHARARLNVVNMCLSLPVYESEGVNQRKKENLCEVQRQCATN